LEIPRLPFKDIIFAKKINKVAMWQRIQSIYLFIAGLSVLLLSLLPIPLALFQNNPNTSISSNTPINDGILTIDDYLPLLGLGAFIGLVAIIAIFLFKNRKAQIKLVYLLIFLLVCLAALCTILAYKDYFFMKTNGLILSWTPSFGIGLPIISLILFILAAKYIKKDEKLVRSMDRLR